jgi:hypothetical protein
MLSLGLSHVQIQSSQWVEKSSLRQKRACQCRSNMKVLLIAFLWEWICSTWSARQWTVLLGGYEAFEGGRAKEGSWGVEKQDLDATPRQHDNTPAHMSPLVRKFFTKHESLVAQPPQSPHLSPTDFFLHEVEIHCERSPISNNRKHRRKFAMGTTRYPAKRFPEFKEILEAVYRQRLGVLWRRHVLLSCKLIKISFKRKFLLHFGEI